MVMNLNPTVLAYIAEVRHAADLLPRRVAPERPAHGLPCLLVSLSAGVARLAAVMRGTRRSAPARPVSHQP